MKDATGKGSTWGQVGDASQPLVKLRERGKKKKKEKKNIDRPASQCVSTNGNEAIPDLRTEHKRATGDTVGDMSIGIGHIGSQVS